MPWVDLPPLLQYFPLDGKLRGASITKPCLQKGKVNPPITVLKGVGSQVERRLAKLGVHTVVDLLFHLPLRYEDRTTLIPINALIPGAPALIAGEVLSSRIHRGKRRMLLVSVSDGTGVVGLRFFHFSPYQQNTLEQGARLQCFGEVRRGGQWLEMVHPEWQLLAPCEPGGDGKLTAIYPLTGGLFQGQLRKLIREALIYARRMALLPEYLPASDMHRLGFSDLYEAVEFVHQPPSDTAMADLERSAHPCQQRLAFEELVAHCLSLRVLRNALQKQPAQIFPPAERLAKALLNTLTFSLTGAQQRVVRELWADLARPRPMCRLVQGDVGSGKTIVAALAALCIIEQSGQVAVMAPTELLAEQHLENFKRWFEPLGITVSSLSGRMTKKARAVTLDALSRGDISLLVGTQALFQEEVSFHSLGLLIIDEQHRFGVAQRLALRAKGITTQAHPHQLIMTATPIPRTLTMAVYADIDISVIDEMPANRQPIDTVAVSASRRDDVIARVERACRNGQQAYWVCPLIEESEVIRSQAARVVADQLAQALPSLRVGLLHGRMKSAEKDRVMTQFKARSLDLLVSTTVIEVGVDVPSASLMIIENAERLGLAQLHQLRGRVGRGEHRSHCVLVYEPPLSPLGKSRIAAMRETTDGFKIAERDLQLRGPGEILGTRQTGLMHLRIADIVRDRPLLPEVNHIALQVLKDHPEAVQGLLERWVGRGAHYAGV